MRWGSKARRRRVRESALGADEWARFREEAAAEIRALGFDAEEAEAEAKLKQVRTELRLAWLREKFDAFIAAQDAVGEAWARLFDEHPEIDWDDEEVEAGFPDPPEQALCDALYAELAAARDEGRWPRHLHFHMV